MKSLILTFSLFLFSITVADACRCVTLREFSRTLEQNDQIFIGKVVSKYLIADTVKFHITIQKKWKGNFKVSDEVILSTSTGSCGMEFEIGETYVIYSKKNYTNICRRNKKVGETFDERLLDYYFYGNKIPTKPDEKDQKILRNKLQISDVENPDPGSIIIVYDYRVLSALEIYKLNPLNFSKGKFITLSLEKEEQSEIGSCVDKVIVMGSYLPKNGWNKKKVLKAVKKKNVCQ